MLIIKNYLHKNNIEINLTSNFSLLLLGNGLSSVIQFLITIAILKYYPVETYGIFTISTSISLTIYLLVNSGFLYTLIRMVSKSRSGYKDPDSRAIVIIIAVFEVLLLAIVSVAYLLFIPKLTPWLNLPENGGGIIIVSLISAYLILFTEFIKAIMQATDIHNLIKYFYWYTIIRFVSMMILVFWHKPDASWLVLWTYIIPLSILTIVFIKYVLPFFNLSNLTKSILQSNFKLTINYSKWMAISAIIYPQLTQILVFIIAHSASPESVGLFNAGFTFTSIFSLLNISLRQIFFPYVSRLKSNGEINNYIGRIKKFFPYYMLISLIVIAVFSFLMYFIFGSKYRESLPVFIIIGSSTCLVVFLGQINLLSHTLYKPQINAIQALAQSIVLIVGGIIIISLSTSPLIPLSVLYGIVLLLGEIGSLFYILSKLNSLNPETFTC